MAVRADYLALGDLRQDLVPCTVTERGWHSHLHAPDVIELQRVGAPAERAVRASGLKLQFTQPQPPYMAEHPTFTRRTEIRLIPQIEWPAAAAAPARVTRPAVSSRTDVDANELTASTSAGNTRVVNLAGVA